MVTVVEQLKDNIHASEKRFVEEQFSMKTEQNISNRLVGSSTKQTHLDLNGDWFKKYGRGTLGRVSDYHSAQIVDSVDIKVHEKPVVATSDEEGRREPM